MDLEFGALLTMLVTALSSAGAAGAIRAFIRRDIKDVQLAPIDQRDLHETLIALRDRLDQGGEVGGTPEESTSKPDPTPGELEARAIMTVFSQELTEEARRVAKRAKAERPSPEHVRVAADRIGVLRDRAGAASDFALAVGSIFVGGAVAFQVNLMTGGEATDGTGLWAAIALAVGVGIVVAAGVIKWRKV